MFIYYEAEPCTSRCTHIRAVDPDKLSYGYTTSRQRQIKVRLRKNIIERDRSDLTLKIETF